MTRFLEKLFNLHRGDLRRGSLLFLYLFLVIGSYVVGKAARDALFLDQFKAIELPYADIAIAILVGLVVTAYVRIGRRVGLRSLQIGSLIFFAANALFFWWLATFFQWTWTFPVLYVWMGMFGVLAPAQVWTLANYTLTTREAKRLYGLVGSGAIAGWIFGGAFTKLFAQHFGTESLLLCIAASLGSCAILVGAIWSAKSARTEKQRAQEIAGDVRRSLSLLWSSTYLRAIAAVICLSSFVTTIAGWQFKAFAKQFLQEKDKIAVFFGDFNFYAGILSLAVNVLLTSRLLKRFGLGPALFVVPCMLLVGSAGVLVWATLAAAVFLKGGEQILRYSVDRSSVELLYLPVPAGIKVQVKSFIDTVIWRLGDGLAGVSILLFAAPLGLAAAPAHAAWINLALIGLWLVAAFTAQRQYVFALRESIRKHRLDTELASAPILDRATTEVLAQKLESSDSNEIIYALELFDLGERGPVHPAVRGLLSHTDPKVRRKAIEVLEAAGDVDALTDVETLLKDNDFSVRTEAMMFLAHHGKVDPLSRIDELKDYSDFSIRAGMVAYLASPGPAQNVDTAEMMLQMMVKERGEEGRRTRLEAARLIAELPDHFEAQLAVLLADLDAEVAGHACRAVGVLRKRRFLPELIAGLGSTERREASAAALEAFGDRVAGTLRDHLTDPEVPLPVRREIPGVLESIGTRVAGQALAENLLQPDTGLRHRVLISLNKMKKDQPDLEIDTEKIESVLLDEIRGHYRSYQILGTFGGELNPGEPMERALQDSMNREVERIFRLLGLLYPEHDLKSAYFGLQSTVATVHDNSLELLDNILAPHVRGLLVPLLDSGVSVAERVQRANHELGGALKDRAEAVAALVSNEDPWLKACGVYAIGALGLRSLEAELDRCMEHSDPLLREMARQAKIRLA